MKITSASLIALGLFAAALSSGRADTLGQATAVQTKPDASAPTIVLLPAGSEAPETTPVADTPEGWNAVQLPGPFTGYVMNKDLTKGLEVKPGCPIYLRPAADSGVLAVAARGDHTEITGLYGRWTQIRLSQPIIGYIQTAPQPAAAVSPAPIAAAPITEAASTAPGQPAAPAAAGSPPRAVEGILALAHTSIFQSHPPYAWEIDDESGHRQAYLDISHLLLTEQIDSYIGRRIEADGAVAPVPGGNDIVIAADSLRLE